MHFSALVCSWWHYDITSSAYPTLFIIVPNIALPFSRLQPLLGLFHWNCWQATQDGVPWWYHFEILGFSTKLSTVRVPCTFMYSYFELILIKCTEMTVHEDHFGWCVSESFHEYCRSIRYPKWDAIDKWRIAKFLLCDLVELTNRCHCNSQHETLILGC